MAWYGGSGYYSQPSKTELMAKAAASIKRLEKKRGEPLHPVILTGTKIARSWWAQAWCNNIEAYADFSNRVDRGKRYVRASCVIDLRVSEGTIGSIVQGSRKDPYEVRVYIKPIPQKRFQALLDRCTARADSLEALAAGDFPEELKSQLTMGGMGLFPSPAEILFDCNCPDWASMCKHVAATILAMAPLLDDDPLTLFTLRGIDTKDLVKRAAEDKLKLMLEHADVKSDRVLDVDDEELTALFGVFQTGFFSIYEQAQSVDGMDIPLPERHEARGDIKPFRREASR